MPAPDGPEPLARLAANTELLRQIAAQVRDMRETRSHAAFGMWRQTPDGIEYLKSHPDAKEIPGTMMGMPDAHDDGDAHRSGA